MGETLLFPSPNWFQPSGLIVTKNNWLIYGGPSKSLCVLQPINPDSEGVLQENQRYKAHVVNRSHNEKIVSVDVSPLWPEKQHIITGSADGSVKQWDLEELDGILNMKTLHSHDIHNNEKEEIAGVGYSTDIHAITVGGFGNVVKWDLNSNVVKVYSDFLKSFKPTCIACSQHVSLNVAIGTKQGVVFLLDLNGNGKILYKVRGYDDEIMTLFWCPQLEVLVRKALKESDVKTSISNRMANIRLTDESTKLDKSGVTKELPEDSFEETIVQEDDMFDIYKDHEADEFGHKKFEPIDVIVRIKDEEKSDDFLTECSKLKEDILKRKTDSEQTVTSLVEAMAKASVQSEDSNKVKSDEVEVKCCIDTGKADEKCNTSIEKVEETLTREVETSCHAQKHLLATVGKNGGVRIWSKTGKLVASCAVFGQGGGNKNARHKSSGSMTVFWHKPEVLLIADGKSQLLECNPLKIDCKNKLEWQLVHNLHKRGLFCISSNAPRVQLANQSDDKLQELQVWTAAQDRNLICYSLEKKEKIGIYNTCGGFVYNVQSCPYDAKKVAVSVGDGAVRVWEFETSDDDSKLKYGRVLNFWQNVQGKVLSIAWHPTRENLLAFATAESRVGLLDTGGRSEKPAKTLVPALQGGVYSLCWGEGNNLYACGGGELVLYRANEPDREPDTIKVVFEGKQWEVSTLEWYPMGVLCGSGSGAVALLSNSYDVLAAVFLFSKMIHSIQWHPQQTSSSSEDSPYKNLIAVSSNDKLCNIVILEHVDNGDCPTLQVWKTLSGHKGVVFQLAWNPHKDGLLLSSAQDAVRMWEVSSGACVSIFGGHYQAALGVAWGQVPAAGGALSGGADASLRLWRPADHPAAAYREIKHEKKEKKKTKVKQEKNDKENEGNLEEPDEDSQMTAAIMSSKSKGPKKFLLPIIYKQTSPCNIQSIRKFARKFLNKENTTEEDVIDSDFLKMFGNTNDVNEILEMELSSHLENNRIEAWTMLSIFRGHIDSMIQFNYQRDNLCPFLVSIAPCVSYKYWKDVTQLYLSQMERQSAKGEVDKIKSCACALGGWVYRRAALQLAQQAVRAAAAGLADHRLYREAYLLARARHVDNVAEEILHRWAKDCMNTGNRGMAAICYLALGDPYQASVALARSNEEEFLNLAAELANVSGQVTFANHISDKKSQIQNGKAEANETCEEPSKLKPLPTRTELQIDLHEKENGAVE